MIDIVIFQVILLASSFTNQIFRLVFQRGLTICTLCLHPLLESCTVCTSDFSLCRRSKASIIPPERMMHFPPVSYDNILAYYRPVRFYVCKNLEFVLICVYQRCAHDYICRVDTSSHI